MMVGSGTMIPYEELCEALARWRSRQGMVNGPSARPPQGAVLAAPAAATPAWTPAAAEVPGQKTAVTPNPLGFAADGDLATDAHAPAPSLPGQDSTGEIDLDNVLLVDEDL